MTAAAAFDRREKLALITLAAALLAGLCALAWLRRPVRFRMEQAAEPAIRQPAWDQALRQAGVVRLNAASAQDLERLPRVGPALAGRIVEARRRRGGFSSLEELLEVPGIGPATLEAISPSLSLD